MKTKLFLAASFCVAMAWAVAPASAQYYGSLMGGASFVRDAEVDDQTTISGVNVTGDMDVSADVGYVAAAAFGRSWNNWRLEGELSYRNSDLDEVTVNRVSGGGLTFTNLGTFDLKGDISALTAMANVWYDINFGSAWVPFVGGGLGFSRIALDIDSVGGTSSSYSDSDYVVAYQLGAGIAYKIMPNWSLSLSYRFFGTSDPEFEDAGETIEAEYSSHNILAGVTFNF